MRLSSASSSKLEKGCRCAISCFRLVNGGLPTVKDEAGKVIVATNVWDAERVAGWSERLIRCGFMRNEARGNCGLHSLLRSGCIRARLNADAARGRAPATGLQKGKNRRYNWYDQSGTGARRFEIGGIPRSAMGGRPNAAAVRRREQESAIPLRPAHAREKTSHWNEGGTKITAAKHA